jgi:predicted NBD/HSP70 family sugar kinase
MSTVFITSRRIVNTTGGDPSFLRRFNSAAVLRALHAQSLEQADAPAAGLTVSELAAAVNVSRPTAEEAAEALHAAGWVEVLPPRTGDRRSAGRPARRFRFQPTAGFVIGIDIEAVSVSAAVADLAGTVVGRDRRAAPPLLEARERLETIRSTIDAALAVAEVRSDQVLGAAVGTTGIVGPEGRIRRNNLPGWEGLQLADEVAALIEVPVSVHNHLRLSALGERWQGAAQRADDVVHVHAGQRMGLGVVVGGKPLFGFHGAAGELVPASADAWLRAYRTLLQHPLGVLTPTLSTGLGGDIGDAGPIFDAAAAGDATARLAVEDFARALIDDVGTVIAAFDPEVVVIGGDLARAGALTVEPVQRHLDTSCAFPPDVRVSQLGEESIALGAIRVALDEVESRLFDTPHHLGLESSG